MARIKGIILITLLIFIDQLSKYIIRTSGGFYICNPNIAFGLRLPGLFFWLAWVLIILFLLTAIYKKYFIPASPAGRHNTLYIILIISGAISNMIDRFYFVCIIDFINLKIWPVFNLADVYITIGSVLLLLGLSIKGNR
jgi:signal peptidase II